MFRKENRKGNKQSVHYYLPPLPLGFENLTAALNRKNGNLSSQSDI
jgi:hypothetical protein